MSWTPSFNGESKIRSAAIPLGNSIIFTDSLNGWVSGDSGLIIHTSNGGEDWEHNLQTIL